MKPRKMDAPGVLPPCNGTDARYLILTSPASLTIPEWEELGRPVWSVRWASTVELPGGEARPEYLYAQSGVPCYLSCIVAGTPPYGAVGVEIGYDTPGGSDWHAPTVEQVPTLDGARTLVRDVASKGGRYVTWDRSVTDRDHQRYLTAGDEPRLSKVPVTPGMSQAKATDPDRTWEHDPAEDQTRPDIPAKKPKQAGGARPMGKHCRKKSA